MTESTGSELIVREDMPLEATAPGDTVRASWNFSLDKMRQDTTHFTEEERTLLIALFRWCIDPLHPIRRDIAAERLECSPQLIYQLLTGKYRKPDPAGSIKVKQEDGSIKHFSPAHPSPEFMRNLRVFLALEAKKYAALTDDFVLTPTANRVFTACKLGIESHTPVILSGTSYVGKSWALKHFQAHNNHGRTFLGEMEAIGGLGSVARVMAEAAGVGYKGNTAKLLKKVRNATSPDTLWLLDEMHLLHHTYRRGSFFACVENIRRIYDFTQCGMVLCWTNLEHLQNASQDELLQIWRRGVHKVNLGNMPTKGDIGCILFHAGLSGEPIMDETGDRAVKNCVFPERDLEAAVRVRKKTIVEKPYDIIRQLAKRDGLKAITERIRYGRKLANKKEGKIAWEHFVDAHLRIEKNAQAPEEWT